MKYYAWHLPMHFVAFADAIFFLRNDWWNFFAFLIICYFLIWNVYAYPRNKNMQALPATPVNVKKNGNKSERHFLFTASIGLFFIWNIGLIWRYFK